MTRIKELQNGANLTEAERELYFWQYNRAGSFTTSLFQCIGKADTSNRLKLSLAFPDEVQAFNDYQNTPGYWRALESRMNS